MVIPTFNRAHVIKRAIQSVLQQTYKDIEIIIIDDASSDNTQAVCQMYACTYIKLATNYGVSYARNVGIQHAKGEYIAFLDSDDVWDENKLTFQIKQFIDNPLQQISFGREQWWRNGMQVDVPTKYRPPKAIGFETLLERTFFGPSDVVVKKSLFSKIGTFDTALKVCEDYDLWLRIARHTTIHYCANAITHKHNSAVGQLSSTQYMNTYRIQALLKHKNHTNVNHVIDKKLRTLSRRADKKGDIFLKQWCSYMYDLL